jgi:beta-glucanase (GH16 family)
MAAEKSGWILTWNDEFEGATGSAPDPSRWGFDLGGHGWGNNELQTYTNRRENAYLDNGHLVIQARRETHTGADGITRDYTSARLVTHSLFAQTFGRFEARMKVPRGRGLWPAFWLMGADIAVTGWPACGEIDIMEILGRLPAVAHGTVHGPGFSGSHGIIGKHVLPAGQIYADNFHVFATEWDTDRIRFFVDETNYATVTLATLPNDGGKHFRHPFYVLMNVAVGGNWPGPPDADTPFPQNMLVDYVRVYRRAG